ncbi:alpha/beta-hydrolase [Anaeromyces robustus]|uniref:Alpha/beta-hydrolase n=1 Tax=Anaeromyces robustus TaxID=1754192 RepID=A0A1Y1WXV7_9FUNG|nr:alpha/beta-hydrolase [Anaeromyces robustus]|eukprot:ORX78282.1 alpha/beta-hydrolase [Anaeromyces robustus]
MKTSLFITLLFTLLCVFGIYAQDSKEKTVKVSLNVKKNIPFAGEDKLLDVYNNKFNSRNKKPVMIFIYGGSWVSGSKEYYTKMGTLLESSNYVAVIPNYVLFPNGTIDDMVDDVYNAIKWTYKNISKYGGNPKQISLSSHSAGAHITALTVIKSALNLENNGKKLENLPPLKDVTLMNGPFIFDQDFISYTLQGTGSVENATATSDPVKQALLQQLMMLYYDDKEISPIEILRSYEHDSIDNHFNIERFKFLYTGKDDVVPESSSKQLISEISRTSKAQFEYNYIEDLKHDTLIRGILDDNSEYEEMFLKLIKN